MGEACEYYTSMIRIKFHPAFWLFALAVVLQGGYAYLLATIAVVLVHELAHSRAAYSRGYVLDCVTLMPYGAMLAGGENISRKDSLPIAVAGPLTNFAICICLYALWWAFPSAYIYTKTVFEVSFAVGAFNLLPAYPLDGARIIVALSKSPVKALRALRIAGIILAFAVFGLYLVSYFYSLNYSLGVMAVLLYVSATGGTEKEMYRHLTEAIPYTKHLNSPIVRRTVMVHDGLKLIRLAKHIDADSYTTFEVVNDAFEKTAELTEKEVGQLLVGYPLQSALKEVLPVWRAERKE